MAEDASAKQADGNAAASSARKSVSPLRYRSRARAAPNANLSSSPRGRKSSFMTVDSMMSSTDDILLPRVSRTGLDAHTEPSHLHSAPLALALLPALGGLFFHNGTAVVTDMTLLILAAIFLNWSVRLPWDWYHSAQAIRTNDSTSNPDYSPGEDTIVEEGSEEDGEQSDTSKRDSPPSKNLNRQHSSARASAASELRRHEILALTVCFIFPLLGAALLHGIRSQLSRPSEGLVSNYNLTIFVLGSEVRPLSHLIKLVQARTLHLQRVVNANPYAESKVDRGAILDLSKRIDELETHIADGAATKGTAEGNSAVRNAEVATEVRRTFQPEVDALNRAVRRYEKRATLSAMQTEARLQDLEKRMADAITLAAAAERSHTQLKQGAPAVLLDWACSAVVVPAQMAWLALGLPLRVSRTLTTMVEGHVRGEVRREMRTAGKAAVERPIPRRHGSARGSKRPY